MRNLRKLLFFLIVLLLTQGATAQQWAIKTLPLYVPKVSRIPLPPFFEKPITHRAMTVLPLALEYTTKGRFGVQLATLFAYRFHRLAYDDTRQSRYINHYHINLGTRKYLGTKAINRAWFLGGNMWWSYEHYWANGALALPFNGNDIIIRNKTGYIWYRAFGGFVGKNFQITTHWFVETKVSLEWPTRLMTAYYQLHDKWYSRSEYERYFITRPSILIGYRW
jgi:hypothetical protein